MARRKTSTPARVKPITLGDLAVHPLRKKAERIGTVEAKDEKEALATAYERYNIPEVERFKISVQRD